MVRRKSIGSEADKTAFVERLKEVARTFGSVNSLAKAAGVSEGAMRKWAQGVSEPTRDRLVAVARSAGVHVAWLATGNGPRDRAGREDVPLLEGYIELKRIDDQKGEAIKDIAFGAEWLASLSGQTEEGLATVQVPDDSMAPLLPAGAVLVVDRGDDTISRDGIYAMTMDGALLVRRLQRLPGGEIQASADSPTYQAFRFQQDESAVSVIGRVVWVGGKL